MSLFNDLLPHGPTTQSPRSSISASSEASSEFETESGRSDDDRPVLDAATLLLILQSPRIFPLDLNQASDFGSDTDDELSIIHDMPSDSAIISKSIAFLLTKKFVAAQDVVAKVFAIAIAFATVVVQVAGITIALGTALLRTYCQVVLDTAPTLCSVAPVIKATKTPKATSSTTATPSLACRPTFSLKRLLNSCPSGRPAESKDFTPFDLHDDYRPPGSEKSHTPAPIDTQNLTNPEPPYNSGGLAITYSSPAPSRASGALVHRFNSPSTRYHPYGQSKKLPY
ncbi:hypothetical protein FRC09_017809 [Ceratobasidium sp. 395]|nr:hypothetical protein FRC09_017809 [Ceratobasidium sp. 395]